MFARMRSGGCGGVRRILVSSGVGVGGGGDLKVVVNNNSRRCYAASFFPKEEYDRERSRPRVWGGPRIINMRPRVCEFPKSRRVPRSEYLDDFSEHKLQAKLFNRRLERAAELERRMNEQGSASY